MEVVETPTTYRFQLLDLQSRYCADHIRLLFAVSNRFILRKNKGGHAIRDWGDGTFTLYPFQAGIPYYFVPIGENML